MRSLTKFLAVSFLLSVAACQSPSADVAGWSVKANDDVTTVNCLRFLSHEVGRRIQEEDPGWSAEAAVLHDSAAAWSNALLIYSTANLGDGGAKAQAVAIAGEVEKSHAEYFARVLARRPALVLLSWQPPEEMADGVAEATARLFEDWARMSPDEQRECRKRLHLSFWRAYSDL